VPETITDGLRHLAREFLDRHGLGIAAGAREWRRLTPSAELKVDPESGAWCAIRDSREPGAERYIWTVTAFGNQVAAGRTPELAEARSQAEAALAGYTAAWREMPRDGSGDHGYQTAGAFLLACPSTRSTIGRRRRKLWLDPVCGPCGSRLLITRPHLDCIPLALPIDFEPGLARHPFSHD
jgi:hypothetical protein